MQINKTHTGYFFIFNLGWKCEKGFQKWDQYIKSKFFCLLFNVLTQDIEPQCQRISHWWLQRKEKSGLKTGHQVKLLLKKQCDVAVRCVTWCHLGFVTDESLGIGTLLQLCSCSLVCLENETWSRDSKSDEQDTLLLCCTALCWSPTHCWHCESGGAEKLCILGAILGSSQYCEVHNNSDIK